MASGKAVQLILGVLQPPLGLRNRRDFPPDILWITATNFGFRQRRQLGRSGVTALVPCLRRITVLLHLHPLRLEAILLILILPAAQSVSRRL